MAYCVSLIPSSREAANLFVIVRTPPSNFIERVIPEIIVEIAIESLQNKFLGLGTQ